MDTRADLIPSSLSEGRPPQACIRIHARAYIRVKVELRHQHCGRVVGARGEVHVGAVENRSVAVALAVPRQRRGGREGEGRQVDFQDLAVVELAPEVEEAVGDPGVAVGAAHGEGVRDGESACVHLCNFVGIISRADIQEAPRAVQRLCICFCVEVVGCIGGERSCVNLLAGDRQQPLVCVTVTWACLATLLGYPRPSSSSSHYWVGAAGGDARGCELQLI